MSAMSNSLENDFLLLYFNNTDMANVGDAAGLQNSATAGSLYVSLHTANPGEAGSQTTSESGYTSYARVAVARSGAGWTISTNSYTNAAEIAFPACTGGTSTVKFFGIGRSSSGAGTLDWYGPLSTARFAFTALASSNVFTAPGSAFVNDNKVVHYGVTGAALPTGGSFAEGTEYFVISASGETYSVSTSSGGAAVDISANGSGFVHAITALDVSNGITPRFAAGAIDGFLD